MTMNMRRCISSAQHQSGLTGFMTYAIMYYKKYFIFNPGKRRDYDQRKS